MIWVIGDIHGEYSALKRLLKRIRKLDGAPDIHAIGDLTGRGRDSLSVAQWVLDQQIPLVLGNHDSFLLTVFGANKTPSTKDKLGSLIEHEIFEPYCQYLLATPLYRILPNESLLIHAGVHPDWSINDLELINHQYKSLNLKEKVELLNFKKAFDGSLEGSVRLICNIRFIDKTNKQPDYKEKGNWPSKKKLRPWYLLERTIKNPIIFGHWAALGVYANNNVRCIDGGVAWKNNLIAIGLYENGRSIMLSEPR